MSGKTTNKVWSEDLWKTDPVAAKTIHLMLDDTATQIAAMVKAGALAGGTITNVEQVGKEFRVDVSVQPVIPVEYIPISCSITEKEEEEDTTWKRLPVHYKTETLAFEAMSKAIADEIDAEVLVDLVKLAKETTNDKR